MLCRIFSICLVFPKGLIRLTGHRKQRHVIFSSLFNSWNRKAMTMTGHNGMIRDYTSDTIKDKKKIKICVEGNIGSGKTTLLEYYSKLPDVEVTKEPVDKWRNIKGFNGLELMYEDPCRWSLTFQTYVQLTMLKIHTDPQEKRIKMMERSIHSAKYCFVENLYKSGKMPEIEYIVLTEWFDFLVKRQDLNVDMIVYLQTRPETVHERIKERSRSEESSIPLEYLQKLHDLHEDWLIRKIFPSCPKVVIMDGNLNKEEMVKEYEKYKGEIIDSWV